MPNNFLFSTVSIFDVVEAAKNALKAEVRKVDPVELGDDDLPERIIKPLVRLLPMLQRDQTTVLRREIQLDVSRDPNRFIRDRSRPFYMPGTELVFSVPFRGSGDVFEIRPSQHTLNPPSGRVSGDELQFEYRTTDLGPQIKAEFERTLAQVEQHLQWLAPSLEQMQRELLQNARSLIAGRRSQLRQQEEFVGSLGFPVRHQPVFQASAQIAPQKRLSTQSTKSDLSKWDVFICHAGEDKDRVARPLAHALEAKGIKVWYDEFSLTLGDSLRRKIDHGLTNSKFGVVVLSRFFFEKHWPQMELDGLVAQEGGGRKVILPVWHEIGAEEVRQYSPILADRLAVSTEQGLANVVDAIIRAL